jgi:hypothetical protein
MNQSMPPTPSGFNSPAKQASLRRRGMRSVSRLTKWAVVTSLALATVFSAVAAKAFAGHATSSRQALRHAASHRSNGRKVALPPATSGTLGQQVLSPPVSGPVSSGGSGQVVSGGS